MEKDNLESNSGKWIWGIFYYNKEDDRIFPPKRIPWMGWTVNFANWKSIAALVAMLAFFYFVIFMIERNS
ncbi:DUF5808 domain-containing protein [Kaistella faecalis]|uniref:DUF5808 domain-containing protein n=1 Tax=Kaistella faecalis TaxID=2852098 RepID=UPI001C48C47A|nr:DUF5808 domain-containing protein [Chryseobacterium faecale]UFK97007.1 DUF5808 domain-containing protein [Chryseobacterium faecale]